MCDHGDTVPMWLPSEAANGYRMRPVDRCIAPLVAALRHAGYETVGSCCGHGKADASVLLADGREVRIEAGHPQEDGLPVGRWFDDYPAGHPQPERCPHQTYDVDTRCTLQTGHEGPHNTTTPGHSQATPDTERPRVEGSSTTTHLCNCTDPDCCFVHRPRTPDSTPEDAPVPQSTTHANAFYRSPMESETTDCRAGEQQPGGEPE